jgi:hypothetical protein
LSGGTTAFLILLSVSWIRLLGIRTHPGPTKTVDTVCHSYGRMWPKLKRFREDGMDRHDLGLSCR